MRQAALLIYILCILTCVQGYGYTYLGCSKDMKHPNNSLTKSYRNYVNNSPKQCAGQCGSDGYRYFGLQESFICLCGNSPFDKHGSSDACYFSCTGNLALICGGRRDYSAYEVVYTKTTPLTQETTITTDSTKAMTATKSKTTAPASSKTTPVSITKQSTTTSAQKDGRSSLQLRVAKSSAVLAGSAATWPFLCIIIVLVVLLVIHKTKVAGKTSKREPFTESMLPDCQDSNSAMENLMTKSLRPNIYSERSRAECIKVAWHATDEQQVRLLFP